MKKTLSIILALCMLLALCSFSVSAAEVTVGTVAADYKPAEGAIAVTNEAEFLAMAADGNYYLANDITVTATWNAGAAADPTPKNNTPFTGTLDGNGKTVTVSAPMFAYLNGTVKNLTVVGEVKGNGNYVAAVACYSKGTLTVENVYNKANVSGGSTSGGIFGYGATGVVASFTNCQNDGNITEASGQIGGIIGYIQDDVAVISNCVNNGNLETTSYGAGIIGRFGREKALPPDSNVTITNCANYGTVKGGKGQTSGILGYLVGDCTITDCVNYGEIINETVCAAGILGSCYDDVAESCAILMTNCVNYGTIKGATISGGIAGRFGYSVAWSAKAYRMSNCTNYGEVYAASPADYAKTLYAGGLVGYAYGGGEGSSNGIINCVNAGNIIVDCSTSTGTSYVAGLIAYVNSTYYEAKNNINAGTITVKGTPTTVALTVYNKSADNTISVNNYSLASEGVAIALVGDASAGTLAEATSYGFAVSADQIASGEVAYLINEAAGATIYYQAIGTDKTPVFTAAADGSNVVEKKADGTYGNPGNEPETTEPAPETIEPAPETTVPAPETTEPGSSSDTGDSFVIFAIIAVISVLGVAVVAKKREN